MKITHESSERGWCPGSSSLNPENEHFKWSKISTGHLQVWPYCWDSKWSRCSQSEEWIGNSKQGTGENAHNWEIMKKVKSVLTPCWKIYDQWHALKRTRDLLYILQRLWFHLMIKLFIKAQTNSLWFCHTSCAVPIMTSTASRSTGVCARHATAVFN